MKSKAPSPRSRAFSLVELLVVISVIAIIGGFAVPAVTTMIRGSQLTQGSQLVTDRIALARQIALSRNRSVEVRFYKFADPEIPGEDPKDPNTGYFRAMQSFEILENGAPLPLAPIQRLPINVIMNEDQLSTLLNKDERPRVKKDQLGTADPEIAGMPPGAEKSYEYVALRFLPDGSTDLPPFTSGGKSGSVQNDSWYITLHGTSELAALGKTKTLPANYFTLQIDPITGSTRAYRPTL